MILAKPRTFMNKSGEAVASLIHRYKLSTDDIIVIYDDLDLPLGKIRLREKGSSGGHKGVKSIIEHVGTQDFARIRIGIAPVKEDTDAIEHVLSDFTPEEKSVMKEVYPRVAAAIHCLLIEGLAGTMNKYN